MCNLCVVISCWGLQASEATTLLGLVGGLLGGVQGDLSGGRWAARTLDFFTWAGGWLAASRCGCLVPVYVGF